MLSIQFLVDYIITDPQLTAVSGNVHVDKILNNRLVQCLDKGGALHEGQAGFRVNRSCMDNVYTLNEIVQSRFREDK